MLNRFKICVNNSKRKLTYSDIGKSNSSFDSIRRNDCQKISILKHFWQYDRCAH